MNVRYYIAIAISLAKKLMEQKGKASVYGKRAKRPMQMSYMRELDVSQVFNPKEAHEYQQFVGIKRCIIELGRVNLLY